MVFEVKLVNISFFCLKGRGMRLRCLQWPKKNLLLIVQGNALFSATFTLLKKTNHRPTLATMSFPNHKRPSLCWLVSLGAFLLCFSTVVFFCSPSLHPGLNCKAEINQEQWGVSPPSQLGLSSVLVSAYFSRGVAVGFPSVASHNPTTNPRPTRRTLGAKTWAEQATQNDIIMAVSCRPRSGQPAPGLNKRRKTLLSSAKDDQSSIWCPVWRGLSN